MDLIENNVQRMMRFTFCKVPGTISSFRNFLGHHGSLSPIFLTIDNNYLHCVTET